MDPETLRLLRHLQTTYNHLDSQLRTRIREFLTRSWLGLENYRDADIDRFVRQILPVVLSGEQSVSQLTNAYLAQTLTVGTGVAVRPVALAPASVSGAGLRGVDPEEVYRRPAVALYTALSHGRTMTEAVREGLVRLQDIAVTDLQLAKTHTVRQQPRVRYFRRTLTGNEDCALCAIASTNRYTRGDLMPIHPRCDCGVMPVFFDNEPAEPVGRQVMDTVQRSATQITGDAAPVSDLASVSDLVTVRTHGEYGPTLVWRDQHFDGPSSI